MRRRSAPPSGRVAMPSSSTSDPTSPAFPRGMPKLFASTATIHAPTKREHEDSMRAEPVHQMAAGNLHGGMSCEYARGQESGKSLVESELACKSAHDRRVISVINRKSKTDQTRTCQSGSLRFFHRIPEYYTAPEEDLGVQGRETLQRFAGDKEAAALAARGVTCSPTRISFQS